MFANKHVNPKGPRFLARSAQPAWAPRLLRAGIAAFCLVLCSWLGVRQFATRPAGSAAPIAEPGPASPVAAHAQDLLPSPASYAWQDMPVGRGVQVSLQDVDRCKATMQSALLAWNPAQRAQGLTLVVYHLGNFTRDLTTSFQTNNVKIFTSALRHADPAFYIFQVLYGVEHNDHAHLLPTHLRDHACVVDWYKTPYDVSAQMVTLALLGDVAFQFRNVFLMNHSTRGPLTHRDTWLQEYGSLLLDESVGIAGAQIACFQGTSPPAPANAN
jgi:hypothetical protein